MPKPKHGERTHPNRSHEYRTWLRMKARCSDPRHSSYPRYGAIGITVSASWQHDYLAFLNHVGRRPSPEYSIDRIDNTRGYEPGNVRWATRSEQQRNMRTNRMATLDGVTRCVTEWAEILGINHWTIQKRLQRGWSDSQALSTKDRPSRS